MCLDRLSNTAHVSPSALDDEAEGGELAGPVADDGPVLGMHLLRPVKLLLQQDPLIYIQGCEVVLR